MDAITMHVVNNIFLPRELPQEDQFVAGFSGQFVDLVAKEVAIFAKEVACIDELNETERMMNAWVKVQQHSVNWEEVYDSIKTLLPGETFAIYVCAQNAGLTISIPKDTSESATLAVFTVSASSEEVMKACGDLTGVFPSWAVTTDAQRVQNASFAKQIAEMSNTPFEEMLPMSRKAGTNVPESRNVADASYVTKWLLLAVAGHSLVTGQKGVARVRKKIRDDVLCKDARLPWRRSGEYMTVKVVLQSTLVGHLRGHYGLITYKLILIRVMTRILQKYHEKLETDVVLQMLSKLARRLSKLDRLLGAVPRMINRPRLHDVLTPVVKQCCEQVVDIRAFIDARWQGIVKREASECEVDPTKLECEKHIKHSLLTANHHLQLALTASPEPTPIEVKDPMCSNRNKICNNLLNVDLVNNSSPVDTGEALYDIEVWVQKDLWHNREDGVRYSSSKLFGILREYLKIAKGYYEGDALGSSRMIITTITLVAILDSLATGEHPMLLHYNPGVNTDVLQSLLLPYRDTMEHLAGLEAYFDLRKQNQSVDASLISEDEPSPQSFSVCFADQDHDMQLIKHEILKFASQKEREKLEEVSKAKNIHDELLRIAADKSHDEVTDRYGFKSHALGSCEKCQLDRQARDMKVDIYERPLPQATHLQDAVVYELVTPITLSVLRDALHVLNRDVLGIQLGFQQKQGTWLDYEPLKPWMSRFQQYNRLTTLCSTSKLFMKAHWATKLHPSSRADDFIKPNGFNVRLMESGSSHSASITTYTTETNDSSLTTLVVDGAYKCLQWTVSKTSHDENQVLARQDLCPHELNLVEFKAFGALRAGHNLQIRNIIRALEMQTLSLFQPSVVHLLAQALWQTGPPIHHHYPNGWVRESHLDLQEKEFALHIITQLLTLLEQNRENWKDHLVLLNIVIIGARVLAMSKDAWKDEAKDVLLTCRAIAERWLDKIEQVLGEMLASPIKDVQKIRSKLVDVAAILVLTFDVDIHQVDLILNKTSDVASWLRAVACIHDNSLLSTETSSGTFAVDFQCNLLRRVQCTALRLEEVLDKLLKTANCLDDFVSKHWADANQGQIGCWLNYDSPCQRWWKAPFVHIKSGRKLTLQMDTLRGSFLVEGCPVARLPATITSHQDYARVFGKHVFQVQPAAASPGSFVSIHKLKGSTFTFAIMQHNRLLVTERHHDNHEFELFPSRFLDGDLPRMLIKNYSHWILKARNDMELNQFEHIDPHETHGYILFRPVKFDNISFPYVKVVPFVLNIGSRRVRDIKRDWSLVDVRSPSFQELNDRVLCRLELPHYIHVFVSKHGNIIAELPRMGLSFEVDLKSGDFWSCEQPGFSVSKEQSLGTLVGFNNGLLLKEQNISGQCSPKRSLIIPHSIGLLKSSMRDADNCGKHPVVEIDLTNLASPSFFIYDIDDRLRCLQGPASPIAWLYLALLHASTAHPLPDPFIGLTGTESAMRLLQSPRCWSCMPYKNEAISILEAIVKLSPAREWYPKHLQCMQKVIWPKAMFSTTALDAFPLVVGNLINDSERLRILFPGSDKLHTNIAQADTTLSLKYYWRSRETFGKEAQLDSENCRYFGGSPAPCSTIINLSTNEYDSLKKHDFLRSLAEAGHTCRHISISEKDLLSAQLLNCKKLKGPSDEDFLGNPTISTWRALGRENFSNQFLDLYNFARKAKKQNRLEEFTLLLALLAYLSTGSLPLSVLHCVVVSAGDVQWVNPPPYGSYEFTNQTNFDMDMVTEVVKSNFISFEEWMVENGGSPQSSKSSGEFYAQKQSEFKQAQVADINKISEDAQRHWPHEFHLRGSSTTVVSHAVTQGINNLFTRWYRNKELHEFVANVEEKALTICYQPTIVLRPAPLQALVDLPSASTNHPFEFAMSLSHTLEEAASIFELGRFEDEVDWISTHNSTNWDSEASELHAFPFEEANISCKIGEKFNIDLRRSWSEQHKSQAQPPRVVHEKKLKEYLIACKEKSTSLWKDICAALKPCEDDMLAKALEAASIWRRVLPVVLLPCIISGEDTSHNQKIIRVALGALAVLWTLEQQAERCLRMLLLTKSPNEDVALQKELANTGHLNWKPMQRPEWLILELEGDYLMRTIQVDVAKQMLEPIDNENFVLQLNMGEGKTSVIVPALCASIPDGHQFARLTVLSSLFRMNFDALAFKLGGLLNRRVYTFPYQRDVNVNLSEIQTMESVYKECIVKHGVVVTQPEHRLSFELKVLELCRSGINEDLAVELRNLQDMVNMKARDVLDESDLLLDVKYQVVYTVGKQRNLDGGDLRWKVSQSVLRSAQRHCHALLKKFGSEAIEFKAAREGPFAFAHIRILSETINIDLCEMIADDILGGGDYTLPLRQLRRDTTAMIRAFVLPSTDTNVSLESIQDLYPKGPILNTILILRGLLCYGVLMHALRMRWRVEYGVRPSGLPKMAVPFRAKDVPVERAEYGHPDVAIVLTQISYYNNGLSDEQLLEAFDRLQRLSTRESEYTLWLSDVPCECVPKTLDTLNGVNLDDFVQRDKVLFPFLRRNMRVIDFWLSTFVFPVESKQFEGKLVASAWDLSNCSKEGRPISGFSGTKDTNLLLPSSIIQRDLPELQGTDGAVIRKLLQKENTSYQFFESCISSFDILDKIVESKARVLLDVGALMVELGNQDVATKWLERVTDQTTIEAAIYFGDDNQLMVIDRDGRSAPLTLSPFYRQISRCVVYLDDVHTRGTDLKMPHSFHACVTLGRGITKDRLVQACMRMRMLGEGHSVSFWASQEVHTSISSSLQSSIDRNPTSIDVLRWVKSNTMKAMKDGFRHWGSQGIAHSCKQVVHRKYEAKHGVCTLQQLGHLCTEKEIIELPRSYGSERMVNLLPSIITKQLESRAKNMQEEIGLDTNIMVLILGRSVIERIDEYAGGVKCFAQVLDEEQERELEHELEEQKEVQRPGEATPRTPQISPHVRRLATHGQFDPSSTDFLPLMQALERTSLWENAESIAWSNKLFVTREFASVLAPESASDRGQFLRPVAWLAVVTNQPAIEQKQSKSEKYKLGHDLKQVPEAIVLLSSFEVNSLIAEFRLGSGAHLHMVAPRIHRGQNFMLCEPSLILPILDNRKDALNNLSHIAQLLAFSGSVFFANSCEQDAYCDFLGLCPRPRSKVEDDAFHRGDIQLDGFVPPEKRHIVKINCKTLCAFERSPVPFMTELLSARGWLRHASASDVGDILFIGHRSRVGNEYDDKKSPYEPSQPDIK